MEELVKQEKCQHNFQVLPNDIKGASSLISKETYNFSAMQCSKTGDQKFSTMHWSYSAPIASIITPPSPPLPQDLMSQWNEIEANHKNIIDLKEVCGTVLSKKAPKIANSCWLEPVDHRKMKLYQMLAPHRVAPHTLY